MRKLIRVKQKHIEKGYAGITTRCPIALALNEATGEFFLVDNLCARPVNGRTGDLGLPPKARNFIACFDSGLQVEPFSFYVEVPS